MIPQSAKGVARRVGLTAVALIGTVVLAGGTATAAPTTAETSAVAAAETSGVAAVAAAVVPCGLSGTMKSHPIPGWNWYYYNIRNCHSYAVWRFVDVSNTVSRDGYCHFIRAGATVSSRMEMNTQFDGIYGIKPC